MVREMLPSTIFFEGTEKVRMEKLTENTLKNKLARAQLKWK
jgi:hypothetical protein